MLALKSVVMVAGSGCRCALRAEDRSLVLVRRSCLVLVWREGSVSRGVEKLLAGPDGDNCALSKMRHSAQKGVIHASINNQD